MKAKNYDAAKMLEAMECFGYIADAIFRFTFVIKINIRIFKY
jgi:hypothetical protein